MPQNNELYEIHRLNTGINPAVADSPATLNKENLTVRVTLATETPVREFTPYGIMDEVLLMSGAILPSGGICPLLDSHNAFSVDGQLGSLRSFEIIGERMEATAHFSRTAGKAFTLVEEGHLRDVSVRCSIIERVFVPEKSSQNINGKIFHGPVVVATRWEVKEGSFTPIGADKNAKVISRQNTSVAAGGLNEMEKNPMPDKNHQGSAENTGGAPEQSILQNPASVSAIPDAGRAAGNDSARFQPPFPPQPAPAATPSAETIRAEMADIITIGRMHNCMELAEAAIRSGTGIDMFRAQVLGHIAERSAAHTPRHMPYVETGRTDNEKFRSAARDALCLRAGSQFAPEKIAEGAESLRGYTLREMARECLRRAGESVPADPMVMIGRAFTASTSDFPFILMDTAHKSVIAGIQKAPETFELWTGDSTVNDFRLHTGVDLNAFSNLDLVREGGEYTHGEISDTGIRYAVATYGKLFSITRHAIINDDINAFTRIPAAMGRASQRTCGNAVYGLLLDNPQMPDGKALFCPERGNLSAKGGEITVGRYGEAVTAMGTKRGTQDESLNMAPVFMLTPVARRAEARILLNSQFIGTQETPTQINPWQGDVTAITEARLDTVAGKPWFLLGPKGWTINVAWLFGNKTPRVEQRQGWTVDGVEHKISTDFGAYVQEPRALFKNPGN